MDKELDMILEGKIKLKHFRIDGDTIALETDLDNHIWNLTPRDLDIIIYCLQDRIDKAIEYIEKNTKKVASTFYGMPDCEIFDGNIKDIVKILKGSDKEC